MEISCFCPFCHSSRKSFRYNTGKDVYYCWRCGEKGRGNPARLRRGTGQEKNAERDHGLPDDWILLQDVPERKPVRRRVRSYLVSHHIELTTELERQIGLCGFWLTVPIPHPRRLRFYVQRNLDRKQFLSAPWPKYGIVYQRGHRNQGPLFLVESAFSAIRMERFGHVIATLGSTVTSDQCDHIAQICKRRRLVILLDADAQGRAACLQCEMMNRGTVSSVARLPYGDPCDYSDENLGRIINAFA